MNSELPEQTTVNEPEEPIPARMLNELVYCRRLFYLEHVAGEWDDNSDTVSGSRVHKRVDAKRDPLPLAEDVPEDLKSARSVSVTSETLGITAVIDLVESDFAFVIPVDYKRGAAPDEERAVGRVWPADRVQVVAQALALREAGYRVHEAVVYYAKSKTRVSVELTDADEELVRQTVREARALRKLAIAPEPLVDSPKCPRCSLVGICLPDEMTALKLRQNTAVKPPHLSESADSHAAHDDGEEDDGLQGSGDGGDTGQSSSDGAVDTIARPLRKLLPAREDQVALYVQSYGAVLGKDGDCLKLRSKEGGVLSSSRLSELSQVNVFGNITVTPSAMHELCERGIELSLFGYGGWHYGRVGGFAEQNVLLRIAQFATAADAEKSIAIAKLMVQGKIRNCRTLLRRNKSEIDPVALVRLRNFAWQAEHSDNAATLLGVEGSAARAYFEQLARLFAPRSGERATFAFEQRNRRPPRDPVNAMLSFGYALLTKDCRIALQSVGFDPTVGLFHRPRHGRPALALDLMEEFRPLIVDSMVLNAINTDVLRAEHFIFAAGGCAFTADGRKALIAAYERRMQTEISHPLFGYSVTYRRVLAVQARLLARTILGELARYPSFVTR